MKIKEKTIMLDIISLLVENRNVSLFIDNKRYFVDSQTQLNKVSRLVSIGLSKGYEIKVTEY